MNRYVAKWVLVGLSCLVICANTYACTPLDIYLYYHLSYVPVATYTLSLDALVASGGPVAGDGDQWAWDADSGLACSGTWKGEYQSTAYGLGSATPGIYGIYVIACNESGSYDWDYGYVIAYELASVTADRSSAPVCEYVTFTATTSPPGFESWVMWSAPGACLSSGGPAGQFTTRWPCAGAYEVAATLARTLYANVNVDPGAPLGTKEVSFGVNTDGVSAPEGFWTDPAHVTYIGVTYPIPSACAPDPVVVYNEGACAWEFKIDFVWDIYMGLRPGFIDISSGDDSDLNAENYCDIVDAMRNGAGGVARQEGSTWKYYGCEEYMWGHEAVHLQWYQDAFEKAAAKMLAESSAMGPYPVDCGNPDTKSATAVRSKYWLAIFNEAIGRLEAARNDVVANSEGAAVEAMQSYNEALAIEICLRAQGEEGWEHCDACDPY